MDSTSDVVPQTLEIRCRNGKVYTMHEPSLEDISTGEELLGESFLKWFQGDVSFKTFGTAIWLCARKHGLSDEEVEAGKFKLERSEVLRSIGLHDVYAHFKKVAAFFTPAPGVLDDLAETSSEDSGQTSEPTES